MDPHAEEGASILFKESDRDESSLEKSSTDIFGFNHLLKTCGANPFI